MVEEVSGASVPDQALVASDRAATRLAPAGFDPSRIYDDFRAWVSQQDAEREYDYYSPCACAFGRFLSETGICESPSVRGSDWEISEGERFHFPTRVRDALVRWPWTFGDLHARLTEAA